MPVDKHIRNPFELALQQLSVAVSDAGDAAVRSPAEVVETVPEVRRIGPRDLGQALREGMGDLAAIRADIPFVGLIYPVAGLLLARLAFGGDLLPLVFPLIAGFALIGPVAAVGLYEISRRREQGLTAGWADAFAVGRSPALGSILWLGLVLMVLFGLWLWSALAIYGATLGPDAPASLPAFAHDVLTTPAGWAMIVAGITVGFVFAVVSLAISVVSFPMMLDRQVSMPTAVRTSLKACAANPGTMALWGLIVAGSLALGALPGLLGLIVVMPLLGHATWRLYRKVVG